MSEDRADDNIELLGHVDEQKRSTLRRLVVTTAYVVPAVATFSLNGLAINSAHAYFSNQTTGPLP